MHPETRRIKVKVLSKLGGNRKKEEALVAAKEWKDRRNKIWTDGPRLDDKRPGAAAVWWERAHRLPPW